MDNLSFHITDIAANSIRAKAKNVVVRIEETHQAICLCFTDDGTGMDSDTLERIRNPFYTTRTTRKIGLGLPFLIQNAEQTGGSVTIESELGRGTVVAALFKRDHIDLPPWGDLAETIAMLITGNPETNIRFDYLSGTTTYSISSNEIKEALEGLPLSHPRVMLWLKEMIRENINS